MRQNEILRLDPQRPLAASLLGFEETATHIFTLTETASPAAVFEEGETRVFTLTTSPGAGTRARQAKVGHRAILYG